jgi:peptide/nickel transport system permease protein
MKKYILRRILLSIPTLLGVTIAIFLLLHLIPGDPARIIAGPEASDEMVAKIRKSFGLNDPLAIQYFRYMKNLFRGDLGVSYSMQTPVAQEIWSRLPATLKLASTAMILGIFLGVILGVLSAAKQFSFLDYTTMGFAVSGVSMPDFWLGLMLMLIFSVKLGLLPTVGGGTLAHLVLPAVTLGAGVTGILARMTRSGMLEVLRQDYVRTARAKGLGEKQVVYIHALRNALIPTVTIGGLQFGRLLGGSIVVESVFAWPGIGRLLITSIHSRDYMLTQGIVLIFATTFVLVNLTVDIVYSLLDPRITYAKRRST